MRRFLLVTATLLVLLVPGVANAATNPDYTEDPPKVVVTTKTPAAQTVAANEAVQTRLAVTGSESMVLVLAGLTAVSVGALVLIGRRRFADAD